MRGVWAWTLATALVLLAAAPAAGASSTISWPPQVGGSLLSLSTTVGSPGGSSSLALTLTDALNLSWTSFHLNFSLYQFVAGSTAQNLTASDAWAPVLSVGGVNAAPGCGESGPASLGVALCGSLDEGQDVINVLTCRFPSTAPAGTYLVRDSLEFVGAGNAYTFESRGFFAPGLWQRATLEPNGTPTLNLTLLGVAGVLPETSFSVASPYTAGALGAVLAAALILAGVGGYVAYREYYRKADRPPRGSKPTSVEPPGG